LTGAAGAGFGPGCQMMGFQPGGGRTGRDVQGPKSKLQGRRWPKNARAGALATPGQGTRPRGSGGVLGWGFEISGFENAPPLPGPLLHSEWKRGRSFCGTLSQGGSCAATLGWWMEARWASGDGRLRWEMLARKRSQRRVRGPGLQGRGACWGWDNLSLLPPGFGATSTSLAGKRPLAWEWCQAGSLAHLDACATCWIEAAYGG
jgi:hypothetical protein